jgi:hypothetical protein
MVIRKCRCDSVWCPQCYKLRKVPVLFARINDRLDWRSTRQIVLTIDRNQYTDGEQAYLDVTQGKKINQLVHNLKRTTGITIRDYVWVLEWHKDGFPHWHVFVDVEKKGASGKIHFENINRYWTIGSVNESYFKSYQHWQRIVGYFGKHGYFDKGKAHQARLPEWAKSYKRTIKRSGSGQIQCAYKTPEVKKKEKEKKEMRKETARYEKKEAEKFYQRQGLSLPDEESEETARKEYKIIFEKCGKASTCVVFQFDNPIMGFSVPIPYRHLLLNFPTGQQEPGFGYVVEMDGLAFKSFIHKYLPKFMM